MSPFLTLIRREWMQHRLGWLLLMGTPSLLLLLLSLADGGLMIQIDSAAVQLPKLGQTPALLQTVLLSTLVAGITFGAALLAMAIQLPGLARRDQQDGSAEFWTSLPIGHVQGVTALLLTQILLLPWLALLAGLVGGLLVSAATVIASHGLLAWLQQPWGLLAAAALALLARISLGLLLAAAWLSPLLLLPMAASAWLKRWGLPVVVVAGLVGTMLVDRRLPAPLLQPALQRLSSEAFQALLRLDALSPGVALQDLDWTGFLAGLPGLLLAEAIRLLGRAATPAFGLALAGGALGFALLVLRRRRGA
jgi:ABC-2 type transport system permease protein